MTSRWQCRASIGKERVEAAQSAAARAPKRAMRRCAHALFRRLTTDRCQRMVRGFVRGDSPWRDIRNLNQEWKMRKRSIIGICLCCALMVSAIAAQAASAANGTTAFTCKKVTKAVGTAGFSDAHCKSPVESNAEYE